jgi:hypothetical protein
MEYPTDDELNKIREWDVTSPEGVDSLMAFIEDLWKYSDIAFHLKGKTVLHLELLTLGWSGNEEIIGALCSNFNFWSMFWEKSERGGHYYFTIKKNCLKQPKKERKQNANR